MDPEQVDWMIALDEVERDTGQYGESLEEAMSEKADPNFYGDGAVRFAAKQLVNHAEAAVELYREQNKDNLPPGAVFTVERKTY